jgi:hypothetical protein
MNKIYPDSGWHQRPLLFRFLSILCCFCTTMFSNPAAFSQGTCGNINCTSSEVQVISAYISGAGDLPVDCGVADPFDGAELHLIVSSNTQRIGISLVGVLNIIDNSNTITASHNLAHCFSDITLNNGSNNNLVYSLSSTLDGVQCGPGFSLSDIFISWGTGNTNFCTSDAAQCPATPAKCRFKAGETIPVTVKLDVDFSFDPGVCNLGGNSLALDFTPIITATGLTPPFTYTWDFGDGSSAGPFTVDNLSDITGISHTYLNAAQYTATLTVTDASATQVTKTAVHTFMLTACCDLTAPSITAGPFCSADNKTIADLPQTDGNGGTYHWYNAADPDNSFELPGTTLLVDGTTYYVSVSEGTCESPRTAVTITVTQTPSAPTSGGDQTQCQQSPIQTLTATATGGTITWYDAATDGNVVTTPSLSAVGTVTYYAQASDGSCSSLTRTAVTLTIKALPTASISVDPQTCTGGVAQFKLTATTSGTFVWSKPAGADGSFSSTTTSPTTYTPGTLDKKNGVTITLTTSLNGCTNTATKTLTTSPCGPYYTYTQGYYSSTGTSCTPAGGKKGSLALIQYALDHMDGVLTNGTGQLYLGKPGASFTVNYADASKLIAIMPGGGTAGKLTANFNLAAQSSYPPLKKGKIDNVLLSQAITLKLNLNIQGDALNGLILQGGFLTTQKGDLSTCPTTKVVPCSKDANSISSLKITTNTTLLGLLNGKTVTDLLAMASNALGGTLPGGVSYSDINNAVDVINRSFDGGRFILGYYSTQQSCTTLPLSVTNNVSITDQNIAVTNLAVTAYPNPFTDKVRFSIQSPVSGNASLDIYNVMGQKLHNVYRGYLFAGRAQAIDYNVPSVFKGSLIYTLKVGGKQVNGKVVRIK